MCNLHVNPMDFLDFLSHVFNALFIPASCYFFHTLRSPCGVQHTTLGPDFPAEHFSEDLCYLTGLSVFTHILQPHAVRFSLRGRLDCYLSYKV